MMISANRLAGILRARAAAFADIPASTEVAAKSAYVKARAALQRAMGTILDENHISLDAAYKGKM